MTASSLTPTYTIRLSHLRIYPVRLVSPSGLFSKVALCCCWKVTTPSTFPVSSPRPIRLRRQGETHLTTSLVQPQSKQFAASAPAYSYHSNCHSLFSILNLPMRSSSTAQCASCSRYNDRHGCSRSISRRKSTRPRIAKTKDPAIEDWVG